MFDSKLVVSNLNEILSLVREGLSESQLDDIRTYVNVGEWNLALEVLCQMLYEDKLPIPSRAYDLFQEVGAMVHLNSKTWEIVKSQVIN